MYWEKNLSLTVHVVLQPLSLTTLAHRVPSLIRFKMRRGRIEYKCMKAIEADFGKRNGVKNNHENKVCKICSSRRERSRGPGKITMAAIPVLRYVRYRRWVGDPKSALQCGGATPAAGFPPLANSESERSFQKPG